MYYIDWWKMTTLKDIANECKLSVASVSRVINGDLNLSISEENRILILQTAERLGYSNLKTRTTSKLKIGLLTGYTNENEIIDPYYLLIRVGIEEFCQKNKIEIVRIYEDEFNKYVEHNLSGIIISGQVSKHALSRVKKLVSKIVTIDFSDISLDCTSIVIDFEQTIHSILTYFETKKYQNIGLFAGKDDDKFEDIRTILLKRLIEEYNMTIDKRHIFEDDFSLEGGYKMAKKLVDNSTVLPDVIFCENDTIALGALKSFNDHNIKVPEDIAILGFNDIPTSEYSIPPLSTISIPMKEMGVIAAKNLLAKINNEESLNSKIFVQTKLIERKTT